MDCFATEYYAASKFLYSSPTSTPDKIYFEFCTKENFFIRPDQFSLIEPSFRTEIDAFLFDVKTECQDFIIIPKYIRRYLKIGGLVILSITIGVPLVIISSLIYLGIVFFSLAGVFFFISFLMAKSIKRQLYLYRGKIERVISTKYKNSKFFYYWKLPSDPNHTISWLEFHIISNQHLDGEDINYLEKKSTIQLPQNLYENENFAVNE